MNKKTIITILLAAILGLASCNRDSNYEDKVEQGIMGISSSLRLSPSAPDFRALPRAFLCRNVKS